jgi:hypothetical protein
MCLALNLPAAKVMARPELIYLRYLHFSQMRGYCSVEKKPAVERLLPTLKIKDQQCFELITSEQATNGWRVLLIRERGPPSNAPREGLPMREYAVKVKLTASVRVRAADEIVARRVATSVLLSLTADYIGIPNDNDAAFRGNATVTHAAFSVEGRPTIVAIDAKRVKRSATKRR